MGDKGDALTIKPAGEILSKEFQQAVDLLKGCVTPIFDVNDRSEAELLGSAVLIRLGGSVFLCTAKHVIDGNRDSTLYISEENVLISFESDFQTVGDHDVAVTQLHQEQIDQLSNFTPLEESSIATSKQTEESCFIELVGFPETKNRKVHGQNKLKGQIHGFGGTLIEATAERVRVKFSSKRAIDAKTRAIVKPPDPHGISGGAMFGIAMNEASITGAPVPLLVGISTDLPDSKEMFGTNIAIVLAILRDAYGVDLPPRLNPVHIKTQPGTTQNSEGA